MKLASHLHCPVVEDLQESLTSTEFIEWKEFLDWKDLYEFRREDYYYAQIAAEVSRMFSKKRIKIEQRLLKFSPEDSPRPGKSKSTVQGSKQFWLRALKMKE